MALPICRRPSGPAHWPKHDTAPPRLTDSRSYKLHLILFELELAVASRANQSVGPIDLAPIELQSGKNGQIAPKTEAQPALASCGALEQRQDLGRESSLLKHHLHHNGAPDNRRRARSWSMGPL